MRVPFNKPYHFEGEDAEILKALRSGQLCGNRRYGEECIELLKTEFQIREAFLTPSGTAALEMGVLLADLQPGDEVIMPSYTFSSTATAVTLVGAKPVFCDIDPDTMNMDPGLIEACITKKTKLLMPIDYAGIPADCDRISSIAKDHKLKVHLDAAQSCGSLLGGRAVGSYSDIAAFSFHESKNHSCGEGGAFCLNDEEWIERAHFIQEKGTDRRLVLLGQQNKYGWVSRGSSYLLADILAAVLLIQLRNNAFIIEQRGKVYAEYQKLFEPYKDAKHLRIPIIPAETTSNNHAFFVIFDSAHDRTSFIEQLNEVNVFPYIGYLPLHSSKMGLEFGWKPEDIPLTEDIGQKIVRLPMYTSMPGEELEYCIEQMSQVLEKMFS
jgi:dTDP-4-amino-4,6-dideoxygalactose transaminase